MLQNKLESLVNQHPILMLRCQNCRWRFPVKLPDFYEATKDDKYISCAACGAEYKVVVELLPRAAEL